MVASVMAGQSNAESRSDQGDGGPRLAPHGHVGHQGHGRLRRFGFQDRASRDSTPAPPDMRGLRAPHRGALQDLRLLHQRQEPLAP